VIPVLRAANIPYTYSAHTQTLRATGTEQPVRIALGSSIAVVNGSRRIRMDAPVQRINGTIYAPMRFLELATGSDVRYDSGSRTVLLNSR
jgi:peptidoglycan endopeptidase LytE